MGLHLHLDPLGGIAGDMFIAAMLHARPDLIEDAKTFASQIGPNIQLDVKEGMDKGIAGLQVDVLYPRDSKGPKHYPDYAELVRTIAPNADVATRATDILRRLGEAEAKVHGVSLKEVHFHELSDWDSVVDVSLAAWLLHRMNITSCSISAVPLGGGIIQVTHGPLPIPTPATLDLLKGIELVDDGIAGERVTPTGAAIIAHLQPTKTRPRHSIHHVGYGLGTRRFPELANLLRASVCQLSGGNAHRVGVITFHVDDQSPEDLAIGLDHLRKQDSVLDVLQQVVFGKKGRMTIRVEVLCRPHALDDVMDICFMETSTIGLRYQIVERKLLEQVPSDAASQFRTKSVIRPDGKMTTKAEADDLLGIKTFAQRKRFRGNAEGGS